MLTKADDYPLHQTADPIAISGTDRNFYDRFFFNGYNKDGSIFFALALGVYPNLNVMDSSFCVVIDGIQHNLRASKELNMDRLNLQVGPNKVEIIEPLHKLRITADSDEHGIKADLTFTSRAPAVEEPRFTRRNGPRTFMDYTRMTQNGTWSGSICVGGKTINVSNDDFWGTRDRSWGIRPVGPTDSAPVVPPMEPQFYWIWSPLNFEDRFSLFHINADAEGEAWNTNGVIGQLDGPRTEYPGAVSEIELMDGTRHAKSATITYPSADGDTIIKLTRKWDFCMSGLGYTHPEWGHGHHKGALAVGYDTIDLAARDINDFFYLHVQSMVDAEMTSPDGTVRKGNGVLEQLVIGKYAPWGLEGFFGPQ